MPSAFESKVRYFKGLGDEIVEVTTTTYGGAQHTCEVKWLEKKGETYEYLGGKDAASRAFQYGKDIGLGRPVKATHGFAGGPGKLFDILVDIKTGDTFKNKNPEQFIDAMKADREYNAGWRFHAAPPSEKDMKKDFVPAQELSQEDVAALKKKIETQK